MAPGAITNSTPRQTNYKLHGKYFAMPGQALSGRIDKNKD